MRSVIQIFLAILALMVSASAQAADEWVEYRSDHVLVYSNAEPSHVTGLVEDLEVFRAYLIKLTNVDENYMAARKAQGSEVPFLVFGPKNQHYFRALTGAQDASLSFRHPRGLVSFVDFGLHPDPFEGKRGKPGREGLFYEYARYFLDQYSGFNYPLWYVHGLAMYLSTFEVENAKAQVGQPPLRTVRILGSAFSHHLIPIEYMMGSTREYARGITGLGKAIDWTFVEQGSQFEFENNKFTTDHNHSGILNPETQIRVFKYQAWGIVHYLQSKPEMRQKMLAYLVRIAEGDDFEAAFEDIFGMSLDDFHQAVYDYTERKLFPSYEIEFGEGTSPPLVAVEPLGADGSAFVEAWAKSYFLGQKKRLFAVKNQLEAVGGQNADLADTIIAEMDYFTGNQQAASEQVDAVLTRSPDYGRANGLKGAILVDQGDFIKAQAFLFKAIRADANDLIALAALGEGYLTSNRQNLDEGIGALARLVALNPTDDLARLQLAMLDSKAGNFAQAETDLVALAGWGSDEFIREAAAECLENVQAKQACTSDLSLTASSGN